MRSAAESVAVAVAALLLTACSAPAQVVGSEQAAATGDRGAAVGAPEPARTVASPAPAAGGPAASTAAEPQPAAATSAPRPPAPGGGPGRTAPPTPASAHLLSQDDLGRDWDDLPGRSREETDAAFEYCFGPFASHTKETERATGELIRHTDGLRLQQQVLRFSAGGASASVGDFARAVRECGTYTSDSDPSLTITFTPDGWADGRADVSGAVTFRRGEITLHTLLAVVRRGEQIAVLSVADTDRAKLRDEAPDLLRAAVRRVDAPRGE